VKNEKDKLSFTKAALLTEALRARKMSHSPYSGHAVGAALRLSNGKIYSGANIENASYGGTVCAERVAVWKSVSENKKILIEEICVVTNHDPAWPPCGMCLQVMSEFCKPQTLVHIASLKGVQRSLRMKELMPLSFTGKNLRRK
jgi:cytidine deaminase